MTLPVKAAAKAAGKTKAAAGGKATPSKGRPTAGGRPGQQRTPNRRPEEEAPAQQPAPQPAPQAPAFLTDQRGAPGWFQKASNPDPVRAANAGSGFLLGVVLWGFGLAYLRGGVDEMKRLAAAKFFNKVG